MSEFYRDSENNIYIAYDVFVREIKYFKDRVDVLTKRSMSTQKEIANKDAEISGYKEATESLLAEIHRQDAEIKSLHTDIGGYLMCIEKLREALLEITDCCLYNERKAYEIAKKALKEDS